jgi:hypothetical protein
MKPLRRFLFASFVGLATLGASFSRVPEAHAEEQAEAFARVIVDEVELRTGPGATFRVIGTARRGETLALDGRPGDGFWLRIVTSDGRIAYVLGAEVQSFAVKPGEANAPSRPGLLAPPPLKDSHAGFNIVGGVLRIPIADGQNRAFGYMEVIPQIVLHESITLNGFVGTALTADGAQLFYGGGATVNLAPSWPLCPFVGLGAGGLSVIPNNDSFVLRKETLYLARAGGGFLLALRGRILTRFEVTNLSLFTTEGLKNAQTFSFGLGAYF